jgi:alkanesulfonate monooxygenase SsuD/methylene tetrahydromethanopterin reductase-like flavin-dependent oxidoreductase (luciferase family)
MMVARLAGETSRIKLAPGVVVVPLYNPIRLVSEIGMIDALTHGRLVLGIGSGYQPYEFERFSEDLANSAPKLVEFVDILEKAFGGETFSHKGQF